MNPFLRTITRCWRAIIFVASIIIGILFFGGGWLFDSGYEDFNPNRDYTFRLNEVQYFNRPDSQLVALTMYPIGPNVFSSFSEVKTFTRLQVLGEVLVESPDKKSHAYGIFSDTAFFNVMAYPLLYQKEGRPLSQPFEIVITKEFASRFFLDPKLAIGAKLKLLSREFNVIAIADDPPVNTHLHFDFIVSRRTIEVPQDDIDYTKSNYITYIQLFKGKSPKNITDGLEAMEKVIFEFPDLYDIYLQPLSSIHQGSVNMVHDPLDARKTSPLNVAFELIVLVLLIAIAFMYSFTWVVKQTTELKNTLRDTIFLHCSIYGAAAVIAFPVGLLCMHSLLPNMFEWFVSSVYPALKILAIICVLMLLPYGFVRLILWYGHSTKEKKMSRIKSRTWEVVTVSLVMLLCSVSVICYYFSKAQSQRTSRTTLGMNVDNVLVLPLSKSSGENIKPVAFQLKNNSDILDLSLSTDLPLGTIHQKDIEYEGQLKNDRRVSSVMIVGDRFLDLFQVKLLSGRLFSSSMFLEKQNSYIINRSLCELLNWSPENAVGKSIGIRGENMGTLIGIVDDFNFFAGNFENAPLIMAFGNEPVNLLIRYRSGTKESVMSTVRQIWNKWNNEPIRFEDYSSRLQTYNHYQFLFEKISFFAVCISIALCLVSLSFGLRQAKPMAGHIVISFFIAAVSLSIIVFLFFIINMTMGASGKTFISSYLLYLVFIFIITMIVSYLFVSRSSVHARYASRISGVLICCCCLSCKPGSTEGKANRLDYDDKAAALLGEKLFFDPILSKNNTISCASCHKREFAFADVASLSLGFKSDFTKRNTPSVMYMTGRKIFFWDGRAATLHAQATMPITDEMEMGLDILSLEKKLQGNRYYDSAFLAIFQRRPDSALLSWVMADYQKTLVYRSSLYDRYFINRDSSGLSASALNGMRLFFDKAKCSQCHKGTDFSDDEFRNIGVRSNDLGRFEFTHDSSDMHKFKTPHLRNVALTAPYMHDGSIATLREVIEFYNEPSRHIVIRPTIDTLILRPLNLTKNEVQDLENFLNILTDLQYQKKTTH